MGERRTRPLLREIWGGLGGLAIEVAIVCVLAGVAVVIALAASAVF